LGWYVGVLTLSRAYLAWLIWFCFQGDGILLPYGGYSGLLTINKYKQRFAIIFPKILCIYYSIIFKKRYLWPPWLRDLGMGAGKNNEGRNTLGGYPIHSIDKITE
jgi:hypothetical protein